VLREQVSGVSNSLLLNLLQNFGQFSRLSFLQCGINLLRCRLDLAQSNAACPNRQERNRDHCDPK